MPPILSRYSFFHGFLTFDETVEVLKNKEIYSYLFRFSRSQPESLVMAWKATTGQVKQALLFSQPNGCGYQKALEGQFVSGVASQTGYPNDCCAALLLFRSPAAPPPCCAARLLRRPPAAPSPCCAAPLLRRPPASPPTCCAARLAHGPGENSRWSKPTSHCDVGEGQPRRDHAEHRYCEKW